MCFNDTDDTVLPGTLFVKDNQVMLREHKSLSVIHSNVFGLFKCFWVVLLSTRNKVHLFLH